MITNVLPSFYCSQCILILKSLCVRCMQSLKPTDSAQRHHLPVANLLITNDINYTATLCDNW